MSLTRDLASKLIYAALSILKENGGEMASRQLTEKVGQRVPLDDWARGVYEKTGYVRWESLLHFFSIDCVKAGFLIKQKGIWFLTPEGKKALDLGETGLLEAANKAYRKWRAETEPQGSPETGEGETEQTGQTGFALEEMEERAIEGIEHYVNSKNPYEFQDMVAALLRGMGYYTPFVAPTGKDGGVDITAYTDPLGTNSPRIKVQVKHRESSASVQEVRQLVGLLGTTGDVGLFVSTGGFTSDAKATARSSHVHVELVDLTRFINLWVEFYSKMTDEDKHKLPLTSIYFLSPT